MRLQEPKGHAATRRRRRSTLLPASALLLDADLPASCSPPILRSLARFAHQWSPCPIAALRRLGAAASGTPPPVHVVLSAALCVLPLKMSYETARKFKSPLMAPYGEPVLELRHHARGARYHAWWLCGMRSKAPVLHCPASFMPCPQHQCNQMMRSGAHSHRRWAGHASFPSSATRATRVSGSGQLPLPRRCTHRELLPNSDALTLKCSWPTPSFHAIAVPANSDSEGYLEAEKPGLKHPAVRDSGRDCMWRPPVANIAPRQAGWARGQTGAA